jgi:alkylation response protein AidB-like acyl-CoA dehydrogenase
MWTYLAPLRDMRFVIDDVLQAPADWARWPAHRELDAETAAQVVEEAARFVQDVVAPINAAGDLEGCTLEQGQVRTPQAYPGAYARFVEAGWPALACAPDAGGQGLPNLLNAALYEMLAAANHGWTMYPGLLHGAYECIRAHASPELRERYLEPVASGRWLATMCLTEAHAGSDLGLLRTKAVPQADGSVRVSGSKIFISGGDHDLTPNIVHLVLARLPEAPPGSKGLSLFLVPKVLPDGSRNAVRCDGLEKKMGIKGSATCVMAFDGATGWLVGQPHQGLSAMFVMMNAARLHVALQGLGHLEAAAQNAQRYAAERLQMRAVERPQGAAPAPADPIAWHPPMRRVILRLQALSEGVRVIAYWGAHLLDAAHAAGDAAEREAAEQLAALLTPVMKAFFTELGHDGADRALQVWGGHGYLHDWGIEQSVRDSRIAMIYEGTNEIQALDLVGRKITGDGGQAFARLVALLREEAAAAPGDATLQGFAAALRGQADRLERLAARVLSAGAADRAWLHGVASDVLRVVGHALLAWAWSRMARAAAAGAAAGDAGLMSKIERARFGLAWVLPEAEGSWALLEREAQALPWL